MRRLLKEPLLHFLLLGAALFVAFSLLSGRDRPGDEAIVVSAGKIEHLAALFARTWQRPATRVELEGLIRDYVREEAAYREGMAVGLDRNDTIIRRRIRQKLEFVAEDLASQIAPSEEELAAYLTANPDRFRVDPRLTFRQIYLDPKERRDSVEMDARELLITLNGDPAVDARTLGDALLLEHGYADVSQRDVANLFGHRFAAAVADLEPGAWRGPIESGYGVHLVFVEERSGSRLPDLDEIRAQVEREWANARRMETTERFYTDLVDRYEVVIEWPEGATTGEDARGTGS
jgi:hypothetical protein